MPAKRASQTKVNTSAKRTKIVKTPFEKNLEVVKDALQNKDLMIPCRAMLVDVADSVLKVPKEERHDNQDAVLDMMHDTFVEESARFVAREVEIQSAVDAATAEREEKVALRDAADAEVKAQRTEVTARREDEENAIEVVKECEEELSLASGLVSESEVKRSELTIGQEEVLKIQDTMKSLKNGSCENTKALKKHLSGIADFFKTINTEDALIKTIPQIFGCKPEERGSFDEVALSQMESYMENHLAALRNQIEAATQIVSEHEVAVTAWGAAVEVAEIKNSESHELLLAAQARQENLDGALKVARSVLKEHTASVRARNLTLLEEQASLEYIQEVQKALAFLKEYALPEVQEEEPAMENAESAETFLETAGMFTNAHATEAVEAKAKEISGDGMELPDVPSPQKQAHMAVVA